MTIRNENDWVLPAVLIVGVLLLAAAFAAGFAVGNRDDSTSTESDFGGELGAYTECLRDHGADVPLVESGDGELSVTFFEGDVDPEVLEEAMAACEDLAPGVIGRLLDSIFEMDEGSGIRGPRGPRFPFVPGEPDDFLHFEEQFEEFCGLLDEGFIPPDSAVYDELMEACAEG
jgi:hypothetical protein